MLDFFFWFFLRRRRMDHAQRRVCAQRETAMKQTLLVLFAATPIILFGADALPPKVDLQAKYTKALLDYANLQTQRIATAKQIEDANKEYDAALIRAKDALQAALQAKAAECAALKPAQQIDGKALDETGALTCTQAKEK